MLFKSPQKGFTLVEILVGSAVFLTVSIAAYGAFVNLFKLAYANQVRMLGIALATEQFEIIRNMPYTDIGLKNGIPTGVIDGTKNLSRGGTNFEVVTTIRNIDVDFDGTLGDISNNDNTPADNKMIEVAVNCPNCESFQPIIVSGRVAPKSLEVTSSLNGALVIQVFDSNGLPVSDANVRVENIATTSIVINDVTNTSGVLRILDVPPGSQSYYISITKSGYSSDRTYAPSVSNPAPTKPHATVLSQQITQISFSIDKLSAMNITSVSPKCEPIAGFDFKLEGAKYIGSDVHKYSSDLVTDSVGNLNLSNMEWDAYSIFPTDAIYVIAGVNPLSPITLMPDNTQKVQIVAVPKNSNNLLVKVVDDATKLPISGASVTLSKTGFSKTDLTGQGYVLQTDWSQGSGQSMYTNTAMYSSDDSNVDVTTSSGSILLRNAFGNYNPMGILNSSTFDTGTTSNFYTLSWSPSDQPVATGADSIKMQFATNEELSTTTTWTYVGPDGTSGSYYTTANSSLSSVHNGKRYARYRIYLNTTTSTSTPNVSDVSFTFTSSCVPPGQVLFSGLTTGEYSVSISKTGYVSTVSTTTIGTGWQEVTIPIGP